MTIRGIRPDSWALRLAPQLTGKAQQAYAAMTTADSVDYKKVKEAILRRYDVSEETYIPTAIPGGPQKGRRGLCGVSYATARPRP